MELPPFCLTSVNRGTVRQYIAATTATLGLLTAGTIASWPSASIPKLRAPDSHVPGLTHSDISWIVSLIYMGSSISPVPSGYLMDYFGRRTTLLYLNLLPFASWVMLYFATTPEMAFAARLLAGLWSGIAYTVVPIYVGEIAEPRIRGSLSTLFTIMVYLGMLIVYSIGPYIPYTYLVILLGVFPVLFCTTFIWMPESPYYLLMSDKRACARESLVWLRGTISVDEELARIVDSVSKEMKNKARWMDVIATRGNRRALAIVGFLSVSQRMSGIGTIIAYASTTLPSGILGPNECVIILGCVWLLASLFSSFVIDRLGRRRLLILSSVGCGISMLSAAIWFHLDSDSSLDVQHLNWIPFTSFLIYGGSFACGLSPIVPTIKGEIFPSNIKGNASALTTLMLGVASFVVNKLYLPIADVFGMHVNYYMYSVVSFLTVVFTVFIVIETKGKTLQEIQDDLNRTDNKLEKKLKHISTDA